MVVSFQETEDAYRTSLRELVDYGFVVRKTNFANHAR